MQLVYLKYGKCPDKKIQDKKEDNLEYELFVFVSWMLTVTSLTFIILSS